MNARKLLKKYCLDIDDMPNPHSINPATIVGVDQEEYETKDDNGKPVKGLRSNLWFREFDLPLRLNNVRVELLCEMLGDETDDWKGRQIGLLVGSIVHYGKPKKTLMIHTTALDLSTAGGRPQLAQGSPLGDNRPIKTAPMGLTGKKRLENALAEQGATFDELIDWLKRERPQIHERVVGLAMEDIPGLALEHIAHFLKHYHEIKKPAAPASGGVVINDDDIPF